jgi:predicted amidohydrolase YtcJ
MKVKILLTLLSLSTFLSAKVTLMHNIKGHTINQYELTQFSAIAFEYGRVLNIGNKDDLIKSYPQAKLIDGKGRFMLPGLHDSYTDIKQAVYRSVGVDLTQAKSLEDVIAKLREYIAEHPKNMWIQGYGWDHNKWDNPKLPNYKQLEQLETNKPLWLTSNNGKYGWANLNTMNLTRTKDNKSNLPAGTIIYDDDDKHTGIYIIDKINLIQSHIYDMAPAIKYKKLKEILTNLTQYGITQIDDTTGDYRITVIYRALARAKQLPLRVNIIMDSSEKKIDTIYSQGPYHEENQFLHIHAVKYYIDGIFETHGAALNQTYSDFSGNKGFIRQPFIVLNEDIKQPINDSWQLVMHAAGDRALDQTLDFMSTKTAQSKELRHRIERATIIDVSNTGKLKEHNITLSVLPNPSVSRLNRLKNRIGSKRMKSAHNWPSQIKQKINIIAGSNYPQYSANPFYGLAALVTHSKRSTPSKNISITVEQALAIYTINAAYANRQETALGSLEPEKWADFILVDQDIFTINPNDIWKTKVLQTWLAGKKVYQAQEKMLEKQ